MWSEMNKITIGDLVYLSCFSNGQRTKRRVSKGLAGLVTEVTDSNVYEPAEARVYFGSLEGSEWYPLRALSRVPDEER